MKGGKAVFVLLVLACGAFAQDAAATRPRRVPGAPPTRPASSLTEPERDTWIGVKALRQYVRKVGESLPPSDGGAILVGAIVMVVVAGRFRPFRVLWNLDLLMLLLPAVFLIDIIGRWGYLQRVDYRDAAERGFFTLQFTALFVLLVWWVVRA